MQGIHGALRGTIYYHFHTSKPMLAPLNNMEGERAEVANAYTQRPLAKLRTFCIFILFLMPL
jgi:hypothetical protein